MGKATENKKKTIVLSSTVEYDQISCEEQQINVMVSLSSSILVVKDRKPIRLSVVVDVSGSMNELGKLEVMKETLNFLVSQLSSDDSFSLISYASTVKVCMPLTQMTPKNKQLALVHIKSLKALGFTNLSGGLFAGIKQHSDQPEKSECVSSIMLMTDGEANEGIKDINILCEKTKKLIASCKGCTIFTFGFGRDHNENMLSSIAKAGGGMYYFIDKTESIAECYADCLGGLASVVAQNIKLVIRPLENVKILNIYGKYKDGKTDDGLTTIDIGDLYSEESRDIIFNIQVQNSEDNSIDRLISFELAYTDLVHDLFANTFITSSVIRSKKTPTDQKRDYKLDVQLNRIKTAEVMEKAKHLKASDAIKSVQNQIEIVESSQSANDPLCKRLVKNLRDVLKDFNTGDTKIISKKLETYGNSHQNQRATGKLDTGYSTTTKNLYMSKTSHL